MKELLKVIKKLWLLFVILACLILLCVGILLYEYLPVSSLPNHKIEKVGSVYMHQPSEFTIEAKKPGSEAYELVKVNLYREAKVQIFKDQPSEADQYVILTEVSNGLTHEIQVVGLEIHLQKDRTLEGGSWRQGKYGKGNTEVIR